ncbi:hypothetical protein K490DRAFT_433, partial [Saccharata proteae CBS 121410]
IRHVIATCPWFDTLRNDTLTGVPRDLRTALTSPQEAKRVAKFLLRTNLLDQFR